MKEFWDERFAAEEYIYGITPNNFYKSIVDQLSNSGKALFLAEGEGRNAVYAAKLGYDVTAIDFSESGKSKALKLANKFGVDINYIISDITQFNYEPSSYDLVVLTYAHMPSKIRESVHQKCIKALKPGGKIILEAFNKEQIHNNSGGPKNIDMLYDLNDLKTDFKDLQLELAEETTTHLEEGAFHVGKAEIVRVIARK